MVDTLFAQTNVIEVNDMSVYINNNGTISLEDLEAHFEVPKRLGLNTIFAGQLWIGGLDDGGDLHVAAHTYGVSGADFWAGPVATDYTDPDYIEKYNRVWVVNKNTIENHIAHWMDAGYIVPEAISDWPANGNEDNGEAMYLAPFYDYNVNATYDPANGDYPIIRGDEALFFMMNDDANEHTESGGEKLKLEIHGMMYAFDAVPADTALYQTMFLHYEIFNRSINTYSDVYVGAWIDFDIGCYSDDWIGSDSSLHMFYGYNGDDFDNLCPVGYLNNTPAQGVMFLNQNLTSFMYYTNDFTATGNPVAPEEYYHYLKAIWKDSTHLTYGDDGYGGTEETNFAFHSYPDDSTGWSEFTALNTPSDRRGVGATGPFLVQPGESVCLDIALPYASRPYINNIEATNVLRQRAQEILDFYTANYSSCRIENEENPDFDTDTTSNGVEQEVLIGMKVYPNPASNTVIIDLGKNYRLAFGTLEISNTMGETMLLMSGLTSSKVEINTSLYPAGVYLYKVTDSEQLNVSGKFTVER
jgi:hypothetical protein